MPTLFLHGGPPKTGTSYLQVLFAKYSKRLKEGGVIYPRSDWFDEAAAGQITSGNGVAMAKYIWPDRWHYIPDKPTFINEFDAQLASASGKHILYSTEFLHFKPGERVTSILDIATAHGYEVRVIYLVREIAAAAFSVYSQHLKLHGETKPFSDYIKVWELEYQDRLQKAVDCFGRDSVLVYNFDEYRARLAELFFRDILGAGFVPEDRAIINRSLSLKEAEMLRLMNAAYPSDVTAFVANMLMGIEAPPVPFEITKDEAALLQRRFDNEVEYVNGLVRGQQIVIAKNVADHRPAPDVSEYERVTLTIMAKLVSTASETHSELIRCEAGISQLREDVAHCMAGISELCAALTHQAELHATNSELHATKSELHATKSELHATRSSKSWRVTAPLRWLRS
jgi:hypothetical protein